MISNDPLYGWLKVASAAVYSCIIRSMKRYMAGGVLGESWAPFGAEVLEFRDYGVHKI
jgi:hypothetical protein